MGWSDQEDLICVLRNGIVLMFDLMCQQTNTFSVFDTETSGVLHSVEIWEDGIAALSRDMELHIVTGISKPSEFVLLKSFISMNDFFNR